MTETYLETDNGSAECLRGHGGRCLDGVELGSGD